HLRAGRGERGPLRPLPHPPRRRLRLLPEQPFRPHRRAQLRKRQVDVGGRLGAWYSVALRGWVARGVRAGRWVVGRSGRQLATKLGVGWAAYRTQRGFTGRRKERTKVVFSEPITLPALPPSCKTSGVSPAQRRKHARRRGDRDRALF